MNTIRKLLGYVDTKSSGEEDNDSSEEEDNNYSKCSSGKNNNSSSEKDNNSSESSSEEDNDLSEEEDNNSSKCSSGKNNNSSSEKDNNSSEPSSEKDNNSSVVKNNNSSESSGEKDNNSSVVKNNNSSESSGEKDNDLSKCPSKENNDLSESSDEEDNNIYGEKDNDLAESSGEEDNNLAESSGEENNNLAESSSKEEYKDNSVSTCDFRQEINSLKQVTSWTFNEFNSLNIKLNEIINNNANISSIMQDLNRLKELINSSTSQKLSIQVNFLGAVLDNLKSNLQKLENRLYLLENRNSKKNIEERLSYLEKGKLGQRLTNLENKFNQRYYENSQLNKRVDNIENTCNDFSNKVYITPIENQIICEMWKHHYVRWDVRKKIFSEFMQNFTGKSPEGHVDYLGFNTSLYQHFTKYSIYLESWEMDILMEEVGYIPEPLGDNQYIYRGFQFLVRNDVDNI